MTVLWLWGFLLIHSVFSYPFLFNWNTPQKTLGENDDEVRVGWHDPRVNGGRFLDVR